MVFHPLLGMRQNKVAHVTASTIKNIGNGDLKVAAPEESQSIKENSKTSTRSRYSLLPPRKVSNSAQHTTGGCLSAIRRYEIRRALLALPEYLASETSHSRELREI